LVKRITDDEKRRILESFRSGIRKSEISKKFEVSISTVNRIINNFQDKPVQRDKIEDILERSGMDEKPLVQPKISGDPPNDSKGGESTPGINAEIINFPK